MYDQLIQLITRLRGYSPVEVVFELAIIWIVLYLTFRFLRGTRGARVLKGVGLVLIVATIMVVFLGGDESSFARLQFLLNNFVQFALLALIIVFQPELRRALVRIGEARIFRGRPLPTPSVIEEVVRAVAYLSKQKIGAIIAIEQEFELRSVSETGTPLNADVSAPLLNTIFWPSTPLHDMGVVISGDKIVAAGAQFPLAEGEDLSQELGSRHRAAMGLSQEGNCLVIVVSEETGAISLAERGQLIRKISPEALRATLRRGLGQPSPPSRSPRTSASASTPKSVSPLRSPAREREPDQDTLTQFSAEPLSTDQRSA